MKKIVLSVALATVFGVVAFAQNATIYPQMAYAKTTLKSIHNGEAAYKSLVKNADKELTNEIVPVTEKNIVAISGDKHDYVSMGPYWWPNPAKADGLPYIRKDGQRNPETQKLDRNKLDKLSKGVNVLAYAYYYTGDEKYAEKAVSYLKLWFLNADTKMNPNMNYGQMIPGHNQGKGRAEGMIDTYCFVRVVDGINMLSTSKAMKKSDLDGLKLWFSDFLGWMLTSEVGKDELAAANNHGTAFDVQVVSYALFTGKQDIATIFIKQFAEKRLFKQIEPDGSQPLELARTIAMHYSIFNMDHAMDMCALAQSVGVDLYTATSKDGRSIAKALEFIKPYLGKPQSEFPYPQIKEWDENQQKLTWLLRRSTLFQANAEYDKLFDKYNRSNTSDVYWLMYAK